LKPKLQHNAYLSLVFDFGGVIFDWNPYYLYRSFFDNDRRAVELFLEEIKLKEWNFALDEGAPFSETVERIASQNPQYGDLIRAFDDRWIETMGGVIQPTIDLLAELHENGIPLFALSNWSAETFPRIRHQYDFLDWFDQIVLSGEEKICKPNPRIFQRFLERTGNRASNSLFIDDSPVNIQAASRLGFDTVLFESAEQLKEEIIKRGLLN
jgi:2-haloacid dehalogenase